MKTIKSLKDITTLEVGDVVVFGNLEYEVTQWQPTKYYYLDLYLKSDLHPGNDKIFNILNLIKEDFIAELGINANCNCDFPETKSLEALTALVSALFKEYEKQQNVLPKTWEEFCKKNPIKPGECLINSASGICVANRPEDVRDTIIDKNYHVSKSDAEAFLALMQLRQLRKCYVGDWEPDWTDDSKGKYCINFYDDQIRIETWVLTSHVLSFPTKKLAHQFLTNFKDLIKIAKPLL
jgi:hypothetical protein